MILRADLRSDKRGGLGDMGFSWNPIHYIEKGGKALATAAYDVGVKYNPAIAIPQLTTKYALGHPKESFAAGLVAAGAAFGIPPTVTGPLALAILKTGKVPPGTDPQAAALAQQYLRDHPVEAFLARYQTPLMVGAAGAVGLLLVSMLRRPREP